MDCVPPSSDMSQIDRLFPLRIGCNRRTDDRWQLRARNGNCWVLEKAAPGWLGEGSSGFWRADGLAQPRWPARPPWPKGGRRLIIAACREVSCSCCALASGGPACPRGRALAWPAGTACAMGKRLITRRLRQKSVKGSDRQRQARLQAPQAPDRGSSAHATMRQRAKEASRQAARQQRGMTSHTAARHCAGLRPNAASPIALSP